MKYTTLTGHTWTIQPGITPGLTSAYHYTRQTGTLSRIMASPEWILDYTVNDAGTYRIGSSNVPWQPRQPGTAHLYAPLAPHWEDLRAAPLPAISNWITFTGGEYAGLPALTADNGLARFNDPDGILRTHLEQLVGTAQTRGDDGYWQCQAAFMEILDLLLHSHIDGPVFTIIPPKVKQPAGLAARVRRFIEPRLSERLTLKRIAAHCSVSVSTLTHRYHTETGESPWATVLRLRLELAKTLLLHGERLKEIALQTGFSDEYHFSKTFKKQTGITPRRFRDR